MSEYFVDITIVSIILGFAIMGFISGFTGKVLSLMSWVLSIANAFYLYPYLTPFARGYISSEMFADLAAFGVVFFATLIVLIWISKTLSGSIKKSKLGSIDRNLGILLGVLVGIFFLSVIVLGMRFVINPGSEPEAIQQSKFLPWLEYCADKFCTVLPDSFSARVKRDLSDKERVSKRARNEAAVKLAMLKPQSAPDSAADDPSGYQQKERDALSHLFEQVGT